MEEVIKIAFFGQYLGRNAILEKYLVFQLDRFKIFN